MIELSTNAAIMLYLSMTLIPLLGLWVFQHWSARQKKIDVSDQELHVCEYCHFAYLEEIATKITKCPQCHSFNKNNRHLNL
jgi:uncharacterized paraquat-inducible protein A